MDFEAKRLTKALRGLDSQLFVRRDESGTLAVYCERLLRPDDPEFVVALTRDWTRSTQSREWGVEAIIAKLQSMRRSPVEVLDDCIRHNQRNEASRTRARRNEDEAFLKDWRRSFAKAADGINTSTIAKVDGRRNREKRIHGN
jgi:hypothetical protein